MRHTLYLIAVLPCLFISAVSFGQADTSVRTIPMNEVVIAAAPVKTVVVSKKVNTIVPTYYIIDTPLSRYKRLQERYHVTKFEALEKSPVILQSVELKIKPYDSSLFTLNFVVFSVCDGDTLYKVFNLDEYRIKHHKVLLDLSKENIVLCSADFYMGYGKVVKKIPRRMSYRMYWGDKGESAFLYKHDGKLQLQENENIKMVFPFTITYKMY